MLISNEIEYQTDDGQYGMKISKDSINRVVHHCQSASPNETGGILVGYYSDDLRCAIVTDITGPPVDSVLKSCFFYRGIKGLQNLLNLKWKQRRHYYLGEWHFHPFSLPIPSRIDKMQMMNFANNRLLNCPEPILMILGGHPAEKWEIKVYVFVKNTKKELEMIGR